MKRAIAWTLFQQHRTFTKMSSKMPSGIPLSRVQERGGHKEFAEICPCLWSEDGSLKHLQQKYHEYAGSARYFIRDYVNRAVTLRLKSLCKLYQEYLDREDTKLMGGYSTLQADRMKCFIYIAEGAELFEEINCLYRMLLSLSIDTAEEYAKQLPSKHNINIDEIRPILEFIDTFGL